MFIVSLIFLYKKFFLVIIHYEKKIILSLIFYNSIDYVLVIHKIFICR